MMVYARAAIAAVMFAALAAPVPALAGSASNTRWYSSVNKHGVVVRVDGAFYIVDEATGYTLYEPGACKKVGKASDAAVARALKSKLIYFCSRGDKKKGKFAWSDSEFHLSADGGSRAWRLLWPGDTEAKGKPLGSKANLKAVREVKEVANFDKVLDGIPCVVKFEKDVNNREYVVVNAPFGFCADGQPKDGTIGTGEFACDSGVDPTFLGKRTVKLANRGDAKSPKLFLLVSTREATACAIKGE